MTITQLKYILAIATYKNFTVAAESCSVTQPTLSMQIQKIEDELNVKIFLRSKRKISLTPIGEKIVEQTKLIINETERIKDIVSQHKGYIGGEFKLGIAPTIMPTLVPLFLSNFKLNYPKVNLFIEESSSHEIVNKLVGGELDAGLVSTPLKNEAINEQVLYYEPLLATIPNNHKLTKKSEVQIENIELEDVLLLQDGDCLRNSVLNLFEQSEPIYKTQNYLESKNLDTLVKLAQQGLGITIVPYLQTLSMSENEKTMLREFESPQPAREVSFVYHKSQLKGSLIKALKSTLVKVTKGIIPFSEVNIVSPIKCD